MSDSWKDCEGQVIDGQFTLLQHLGGSDHSVVFATQRGKGKTEKAAIKFIQADPATAEAQLARWRQTAQLTHPNLIKLFEAGRCQMAGMDLLYVTMEFAQENLAQFLPERALSAAETRDMLEPFIETLTHLHSKGFVHGRIKPGNILAIDDQLKLSSDSVCREGETQIGAGKPDAHTAPEATEGKSTAASDVWSLGMTLVEALTQRVPEEKEQDEWKISDAVPQPFLDIARRSLRHDPKARWTVAEISNRLNPVAAAPPVTVVSAAEPTIPEPIKPSAPSKAAAGASAGAAPGAKTSSSSKSKDQPKPAAAIDPLSVPLSTVAPLSAAKQQTLGSQNLSGGITPSRSYYVFVAIIIALTVGAVLAIPRLRDHSAPDTSSVPVRPTGQPEGQPASSPVRAEPPSTAKPQQKTPSKPAPSGRGIDGPPQVSSTQPPKTSSQQMTNASEKEYLKKDPSSTSASPAATAPPASRAESVAAAPSTSGGVVATIGPVSQGEALNQILPELSAKSRSTIRGTVRVVVKMHVDASGNVTGTELASSPSKFFGDAAVQAAKKWDFSPAKVAGQAVPSEWLVRFDFTQTETKMLPSQTKP